MANDGFRIARDEDLPVAAALSTELARATLFMKHLRIAIADRVPPAGRPGT